MKTIEIIGGGTVFHIRNHLALTAPAYGSTARLLEDMCYNEAADKYDINLHLTKMANKGKGKLETNADVSKLVDELIANPDTKIIFFNPALVDYAGSIVAGGHSLDLDPEIVTPSGKYEERLKTAKGRQLMVLTPSDKILGKIRKERKDIFLVAFKTTCGATEDEQFLTGLHLLKTNSCNLVLANDTKTRTNMIVTPEQARYCVTKDREAVLDMLVQMAVSRADGQFTRSTVVAGESVAWDSPMIPLTLRTVVNHCIKQGAYKPFNGSTVGHFALKINEKDFITSKRKVNFNNLDKEGMVHCRATGDTVLAYGAKPSVGGQSQRIIFKDHPDTDCIVHFHCPPKPNVKLSTREQKWFECGSHECGKNTSKGLAATEVPGVKCVYLDNHGPNIVFNRDTDPQLVIDFIDRNFDLTKSTDQVNRNVHSLQ